MVSDEGTAARAGIRVPDAEPAICEKSESRCIGVGVVTARR